MNGSYKYYAFISYKREDGAYAQWLQKKLQNYRLPALLQKKTDAARIRLGEDKAAPKRLSPIFRDQSDLVPGILSESLYNALAESRYLIVICSRNAFRKSTYLDLEIRSFLESGHSVEQIIPLIVDTECTQPEQECFPPELQKLCQEHELLGVNFKDSAERTESARRNDAFLKIIAYMLGVQMPEVKNLDVRRRRKNLLAGCLAGCLALAALLFGLGYYDAHYKPHVNYYRDYVLQDNVAQGIYPLTEAEAESLPNHYKFTTVDSLVRTVEYLSYDGTAVDAPYTVLNEGASKIEYTYENREVKSASYYTFLGHLLVCHNFWDAGTRISFSRAGDSAAASFASIGAGLSDFNLVRTPVSKLVQTLEEGRVTLRLFARGDHYTPTPNQDSVNIPLFDEDKTYIYGYLLSYDDMGRLTRLTYVSDGEGTPNGVQDGINSITYEYDEATGALILETHYDIYGKPALNSDGWASSQVLLNDQGLPETVLYLDENGEPLLLPQGYAGYTGTYEGAVITEKCFLGEDLAPAAADGYVIMRQYWEEPEKLLVCEYLDAERNPALCLSENCYGWRTEHRDELDSTKTFLDRDGAPLRSVRTHMFHEANDRGEGRYILENYYYDADGKPVTGSPASERIEYDEHLYRYYGTAYFDAEGKPICCSEGYARQTMEHSALGDLQTLREFDAEGNQLKRTEFHFNEQGYLTKTLSYTGKNEEQFAGTALERDANGTVLSISTLDRDGSLMEDSSGIAVTKLEYDGLGRLTARFYWNRDHLPVFTDGYTRQTVAYDEWGNLLSIRYWSIGIDDRDSCRYMPVNADSTGISLQEFSYDAQGNQDGIRFFGTDGAEDYPVISEEYGFSAMETTYDSQGCLSGNVYTIAEPGSDTQKLYYDAEGNFTGGVLITREPDGGRTEIYFDAELNIADTKTFPE